MRAARSRNPSESHLPHVSLTLHARQQLAEEIARGLGTRLGEVSIKGYADGEIGIQVCESVRCCCCCLTERLDSFRAPSRVLLPPLISTSLVCSFPHLFGAAASLPQIQESVRGQDCYIVQPTCPPRVNDALMQLLLLISTFRRAAARNITAIIPYYGYARQDRKMEARVPISAADVARLLESMGVDRVVAVDLHCGQIQVRRGMGTNRRAEMGRM